MRLFKLFILLLFTFIGEYYSVAQEQSPEEFAITLDSLCKMPKHFRTDYEITKDIFSWYPIGFIQLDNYTMFRDNDANMYLLTDYNGKDVLATKYIIYRKDVCLVEPDLWDNWAVVYMTYHELYQFEKLIPDGYTESLPGVRYPREVRENMDLTEIEYSIPPDGFLLVLMTGKAYTIMTYLVWSDPRGEKPITFPNENAYYRVLMPLWRKTR